MGESSPNESVKIGELIGKGAIGEVYKALDSETANTVAIKQIVLYSISAESIRSIESEINLLKKLGHPNIVKYIECIQTKTHINLVLEYVEGGSLHDILKRNGKMGEHLVFILVKQILEGLVYLHNQGIIHRDIKGANLLLTKNGVIKLADFGYSILNDKNKSNSVVGTSCWMAPEVIEPKGIVSPKCDIWSLGSTIIQLLTTKPPYYEFNAMGAMFRIVMDKCPPLPSGISDILQDFLLKCFEKDPEKRASAKELLSHPWITTPNKKLVKKFIYENENSCIPINLINEWKNNYRDNLSSIASNQNEKERSKSNSVIELNNEDIINNHINKNGTFNNNTNNNNDDDHDNDIIRCTKSKDAKSRKELSSPKQNYAKQNKLIEIGRVDNKKNSSASSNGNHSNNTTTALNKNLASPDSKSKYHNELSNQNKHLQYSNLSLKNLNGPNIHSFNNKNSKKQSEANNTAKQPKLNQSNDNTNNNRNENMKSSSFNDDNYYIKAKANISEIDNESINININKEKNTYSNKQSLNTEIHFLLQTLQQLKNDNLAKVVEDPKIATGLQLKFPKEHNHHGRSKQNMTDDYEDAIELQTVLNELEILWTDNKLTEYHLFIDLIKLNQIFIKSNHLITEFIQSNSIVELVNLLNYKSLNVKIVFVMINIINCILHKCPHVIEDIITYQLFFHLSRLVHIFNNIEIKIEICYLINYCLHEPMTVKMFLSSGGLYLLTSMIDPAILKLNDIVLILTLDYILMIIDLLPQKKAEDISLLFIHNKILARLNLILIDLFSDETELDMNSNIIFERILNLIFTFTSMSKYIHLVCNDKIIKTLIHLSSNINANHIIRLLTIFDQIMSAVSNLNKLENYGYIDSLIKLLNLYAYNDIEEKEVLMKIIQTIINQISQMLKLNKSRCDLFVMNDGIDIICSLASSQPYTNTIISIFSELINSSIFARVKLKQSKTLELIIQLLKNKSNKYLFNELIQLIIDWIGHDKGFVEEFISQEANFSSLFVNVMNDNLQDNLNEFLSKLNEFLRSSETIEAKFFKEKDLVKSVIEILNTYGYINQKDIHLLNKVMDFYEFLIKNKSNDNAFLTEINFNRTLDKIKSISKEKHLIIIDEKIKKINGYLME